MASGVFTSRFEETELQTLQDLTKASGFRSPLYDVDLPSKIVSSFGGTLCLVISFVFNTAVVALLAVPDMFAVTGHPLPVPRWLAPLVVLVISAAVAVIPMSLALRRVKSLEI